MASRFLVKQKAGLFADNLGAVNQSESQKLNNLDREFCPKHTSDLGFKSILEILFFTIRFCTLNFVALKFLFVWNKRDGNGSSKLKKMLSKWGLKNIYKNFTNQTEVFIKNNIPSPQSKRRKY